MSEVQRDIIARVLWFPNSSGMLPSIGHYTNRRGQFSPSWGDDARKRVFACLRVFAFPVGAS